MTNLLCGKPIVLLTVAGSRAYGIESNTSDLDLKGICFGDPKSYTGFLTNFEQYQETALVERLLSEAVGEDSPWEHVARTRGVEGTVFEIRKFMKLASDCNPNVLEILFGNDDHILFETGVGREIRAARRLFLSAKAKHTFCGYAKSQLNRIRTHRGWLLNTPEKPSRSDFDLPEHTLIPKDQLAAVQAAVQKKLDQWELDLSDLDLARRVAIREQLTEVLESVMSTTDELWVHSSRTIGLSEELIEVLGRERAYDQAMKRYKSYTQWKSQRNEERAAWERAYGYDIKHGAHLYRLLTMGYEVISTGQVHVDRTEIDADFIKSIRNGEVDYDTLVGWAEQKDAEINELYDAMYRKKTVPPVIPKDPDRKQLDELCSNLVTAYLREQ